MNKCKIVVEKSRKFFVFKSEKGQQLSERENYIMSRIKSMVENGANSYKNTDRTVVTWRASLNGKIAKKVVTGVGVDSLIAVETVKQVVDRIELEEKEICGVTLTEAQKKAILEALKRNDKEAAINALGLSSTSVKSVEAEALIDTLWEDLCNGFKDNIIDDTKSGLVDEGLESGGNWIAKIVAGVAITTVGNAVFDTIYDNREAIGEAISETWDAATDWVEEKGKQAAVAIDVAVDKAKDWLSDVGDAWSSGWKSLGSVFG